MNRTTDWYTIELFGDDDYHIIETPRTLPCHLYLVQGSEDAVVIDAGVGVGDLHATTSKLAETNVQLLLTHTHWDHIGAGHQFERVCVNPREHTADHRVTIDSLSDEFAHRPAQFAEDHRAADEPFPDAFDPDVFSIPPITGVTSVEPGAVIDLGDRELELIDLPGHAPGQLGALDREAGVLYGGDVIHTTRDLYVHFQDCDIEDYIRSLETVLELREEGAFDVLTTSHNPPIVGDDLQVLTHLHDALTSIVAGERDPERIETKWGPANQYTFGESTILTKPSV